MKLICKYTGIELISASGFSRYAITSHHPIFDAPLGDLLEIANSEWHPTRLGETDKKLLLLAISRNCELVCWQHNDWLPAMPTLRTIESSIGPLLNIAGWIDVLRTNGKNKQFPCFNINSETCHMETFPTMLQRIIQSREESEESERKELRLICLENAAKNLSAMCRIGNTRKETALLHCTAEWSLRVTEQALDREKVPTEIRDYWQKLLQTKPVEFVGGREATNDVEELRDFMIDNLPHGSVIAHEVMAHLNRLINFDTIESIGNNSDMVFSARILQTNINTELQKAINLPLAEEPRKEDFTSLVLWARAKANWNLTKMFQEKAAADSMAQLQATQAQNNSNSEGGI